MRHAVPQALDSRSSTGILTMICWLLSPSLIISRLQFCRSPAVTRPRGWWIEHAPVLSYLRISGRETCLSFSFLGFHSSQVGSIVCE